MAITYSLLFSILLPLIGVPLSYFAGKSLGKKTGWLAVIPQAISLLLLLGVAASIYDGTQALSYQEVIDWVPSIGLSFTLMADGLSIWMLLTINLLCLGVTVY